MFLSDHNTKCNSPTALKRSLTVSLLQSPFIRGRPVLCVDEEKNANKSTVENAGAPSATVPSGDSMDVKNEGAKTSKTGAFLKKALSNLKIPGTKKTTKRELAISSPSDFTSLCQTRLTTDFSTREQKAVSFLVTDDNCSETIDSDVSAVVSEPGTEEAQDNKRDCEQNTESSDEAIEDLSFHPEFTEAPPIDPDKVDEQFYYNLPMQQPAVESTEKMATPKKPPRSGYLQPSMSQLTKDREEEISLNVLPELGPLPTPPESSSREDMPNESTVVTPDSDAPADKSIVVSSLEDHIYTVTTPDSDESGNRIEKSLALRKPKPEVPRRPSTLKFRPKVPNRPLLPVSTFVSSFVWAIPN